MKSAYSESQASAQKSPPKSSLQQTQPYLKDSGPILPKVAPEDNWDLVGNPKIFFDQLPQPYRFINKCLDSMIMKPVFNQITIIEEKKKTPEYEGNIKEVHATGYMDLDGVTAVGKMTQVVLSGGVIEK